MNIVFSSRKLFVGGCVLRRGESDMQRFRSIPESDMSCDSENQVGGAENTYLYILESFLRGSRLPGDFCFLTFKQPCRCHII